VKKDVLILNDTLEYYLRGVDGNSIMLNFDFTIYLECQDADGINGEL
jgi:hypothetical protein